MLRTRLFLNLVPFVVILLALGVYAITLFTRLAGSVDTSVMENYRSVEAAQNMSVALSRMQSGVLLNFEGDSELGRMIFDQSRNAFTTNFAIQLTNVTQPREAELTQELDLRFGAFIDASLRLFQPGTLAEKREFYNKQVYPTMTATEGVVHELRKLNHDDILATSQNVQESIERVTRLMVMGMVVALVISSYACFILGRSILEPILALTEATRKVGEGKVVDPVPSQSRDELGELAAAFNKMAAQLQAYRESTSEKILRLNRTMETTLASFPDPIFVLNREGKIELQNPPAEDLSTRLHLSGTLPPRLEGIARSVVEKKQNYLPNSFKDVLFFRLSGQDRFFLPRVLAMHTKEGDLFGVAVVLYDVTRFRLMDDIKTNLLATVSHELKTPLTSVRVVLHLLLEQTVGPLNPKQSELLATAREDAERLLRILNDLLDLSRLEGGNADLHLEQVPPKELVHRVAEEMREVAAARSIKLITEAPADLPLVQVDRQRITHVFANFVSNAIKHSPSGAEVRICAGPIQDGSVRFSVVDHGPGVPEEYQTRIFDRFFRVPGQLKAGAGLGLSIARQIVLAHGGQIGVRSAPGEGSEFYFLIGVASS